MTGRTKNALRRADIKTKEQLYCALGEGFEVRGIGPKAKQEIEDYLGVPLTITRESRKKIIDGRIYRTWVSIIRRADEC